MHFSKMYFKIHFPENMTFSRELLFPKKILKKSLNLSKMLRLPGLDVPYY